MTRAFRYATIGLIWILAMATHWFGTILFAPGTETWALAGAGVGTFVEAGWRENMYFVFAQGIPLLFLGMSLAWGFAKEYEDAALGGYR
jgi:hypothetical protein